MPDEPVESALNAPTVTIHAYACLKLWSIEIQLKELEAEKRKWQRIAEENKDNSVSAVEYLKRMEE